MVPFLETTHKTHTIKPQHCTHIKPHSFRGQRWFCRLSPACFRCFSNNEF